MSIEPVRGRPSRVRNHDHQPMADGADASAATDAECLEFVRFCYRRRRVSWPALYDEMCAVAARGTFRGWGYAELAEHGIRFCLSDLPRLAELTELVMTEERARPDRLRPEEPAAASLSAARG